MRALFQLILISSTIWFCATCDAQQLKLYCEDDRPLQFFDANGSLTGLTVEIVLEIEKRLGLHDKIMVVPWARGLDKLDHDANTVLFTMARTSERESLYQWVGPIAEVEYGLYAKADSPIQIRSLEEAKQVESIGVYRNDIRDQTLSRLGFKNLDRASSNISSFKKLMIGRVSLYADSKMGVSALARASGFQVEDVKQVFPLFKSGLYIAISKKTDPQRALQWNAALNQMRKDQTLQRLQKKFLP